MSSITRILVTNDDGIEAPGLAVAEALAARFAAEVWIFAPAGNRSGVAQALTLHDELVVEQHDDRRFAVSGTPADCVMAALGGPWLDGASFDLVLSGVNWGGNLSDSVMYSGTVGAALAAAHFHLPAIALSQAFDGPSAVDFSVAEAWGAAVVDALWAMRDAHRCCWNVNFPFVTAQEVAGLRFTRERAGAIRAPRLTCQNDDASIYRLSFVRELSAVASGDSDVAAIRAGFVSATPIHCARDDVEALQTIGVGRELALAPTDSLTPRI